MRHNTLFFKKIFNTLLSSAEDMYNDGARGGDGSDCLTL